MRQQKHPWRPEEDEKLVDAVKRWGARRWSTISTHVPNRTSKQCCERWHAYLRPGINHGPWTVEEDKLAHELIQKFGYRWSVVASHIPGRTDVSVKNRFGRFQSERGRSESSSQTASSPSDALTTPPPPPQQQDSSMNEVAMIAAPLPSLNSFFNELHSGTPHTLRRQCSDPTEFKLPPLSSFFVL
eukprot:c6202_g1_i1.p1 GENE.c6202_g1_i1~~c6202_g1_i1.p1  ORF type:complete len:186 (+),score=26.68 c6202_g1_i1:48-605(+)